MIMKEKRWKGLSRVLVKIVRKQLPVYTYILKKTCNEMVKWFGLF
jgi:hypothetical protein